MARVLAGFLRGGTSTLANLLSNAWLLLAVHDGSNQARAATSTGWVRCRVTGEVPLSVPIGLTAGEYGLSIKNTEGALAFTALAIAEEGLPQVDPTGEPSDEPSSEPTNELTTEPSPSATDCTTSAAPAQGTASPTAPLMGQIRMIWLSLAPQQPC